MINFKKQFDSIKPTTKNPTELINRLSVINSVLTCDLLTDYETLIKRPIKDSELNLICNFVYNFNSNLRDGVIVYNLFRLFTETEDWEESTSTRNSQFKLSDLRNSDKVDQITDIIRDLILDCVDDYDYLFD